MQILMQNAQHNGCIVFEILYLYYFIYFIVMNDITFYKWFKLADLNKIEIELSGTMNWLDKKQYCSLGFWLLS